MKLNYLLLLTTLLTTSSVISISSQPGISVSGFSKATSYQPFPRKMCETLRNDAAKALNTTFSLKNTSFTNPITGEKGIGCTMNAQGTGAKFVSPENVVNKLKSTFIGWNEDSSYQADGPTGKATGFTRDSGLLLVNVEWEPSPAARCSANRPISDCKLKPEQQLYTINLQGAMK
jgi:hypothetical protein